MLRGVGNRLDNPKKTSGKGQTPREKACYRGGFFSMVGGMRLGLFLPLLFVAPLPTSAQEELARKLSLPELSQMDLPRWRAFIRPTEKELGYAGIRWLPDFASGIRRSEAEQKPLLFWAMNGHPLGCT